MQPSNYRDLIAAPTETRRIFKGKKTKIKYFPFLASVHMFNQFTCAGSIIHSDLVVTAASCLQLAYNNRFFRENPAFLAVRIGSPFYNAGGERIPVLEVYFHPSYSPRTLKDNIAIMRLEKMIKFRRGKRNVKKIEIDRKNWNLPINTLSVTIVGWGAKTSSNKIQDPWSNKMSMAILPIYPLEECQDVYSREYVSRKNFCGGFMSKGGGACNRDVGAPGVVRGILTGIASFGAPSCGTVDAPTVFTKVGYYYDWIETIMEQNVPRIKVRTTLRPYFIPENIIPIKVKDEKDFKIAPLHFESIKDVIDSKNANRLRMDQNNNFENFLGTMFNGKDQQDHKEELPNVKRQQTEHNKAEKTDEENDKGVSKIYEQLLTTRAEAAEDKFKPVKFVTTMGKFDPEPITSRESDLDVGMNITELEKIAQIDEVQKIEEVDDDDDIVLQTKGKTTPILEEYGLSIELSDDPTMKNRPDLPNYDSERKHQINKSDEPEKHKNDKNIKNNQYFKHDVQEVNESKQDFNDEILKDDFNSQNLNTKSKHQADDHDQLRDLEESINEENENARFDNDMIKLDEVPEDSKSNLNAQNSAKQKQLGPPDAFVNDVGLNDRFSKNRPHQLNIQFNKQPKLQAEFPDESIKYKDVITQLNKEFQHQVEDPQLSADQEDDQDNDRIQVNGQLNEQRHVQIKKPNQKVSERHATINTQTNNSHRNQGLKIVKSVAGLDHNSIKKKIKKQVAGQGAREHNISRQYQEKKPEKFKKESKYQEEAPVLPEGVLKTNTESNLFHYNQVMKRNESLLRNDVNPFKNERENQDNAPQSFERNARPKFDAKLIHGIKEPGKFTLKIDSKENKHEVVESEVSLRHEGVTNRDHDVQKEEDSKNENFDEKLDEQIDQLLKNLDVEDKIGREMIDHVNDRKVIKDTKLLELIENKHDKKKELDDETLLTFLLMTNNNRNRSETIKPNEGKNEDIESDGKEELTIDGDYYEDLTFRTNNTKGDSYEDISNNEMYDILADAVLPEGAVVV